MNLRSFIKDACDVLACFIIYILAKFTCIHVLLCVTYCLLFVVLGRACLNVQRNAWSDKHLRFGFEVNKYFKFLLQLNVLVKIYRGLL